MTFTTGEKMKIAIVCYPTHGGSGVVATELGVNLAQRGHQVHFISYSSPFRLRGFQQNIYYHEVDVSAYPLFKYPPYDLSLATKLMEVTKEVNLDLIHAHYAIPHATSAYLARQMMGGRGPKIVTTLHGTDITIVGKDASFFEAVKFSIEQSDGVTAVSRYLADRSKKEFSLEKEIRVIHNFIDIERFNGVVSNCSRKLFAPNDEKLLIHTSNFRSVKRVTDIIRILAEVRKKVPAKLLLIGDGPDRQASHELSIELEVHEHVHYLGTQDYIENLLACTDIFLLPSSEESFGLAALEAMSCRVPVIASRIGGLPEVIDDGVNGFLHPVGDVRAMAESAIKLLADDQLMDSFRAKAREKAIECFDERRLVPVYERFYEEVINQ